MIIVRNWKLERAFVARSEPEALSLATNEVKLNESIYNSHQGGSVDIYSSDDDQDGEADLYTRESIGWRIWR